MSVPNFRFVSPSQLTVSEATPRSSLKQSGLMRVSVQEASSIHAVDRFHSLDFRIPERGLHALPATQLIKILLAHPGVRLFVEKDCDDFMPVDSTTVNGVQISGIEVFNALDLLSLGLAGGATVRFHAFGDDSALLISRFKVFETIQDVQVADISEERLKIICDTLTGNVTSDDFSRLAEEAMKLLNSSILMVAFFQNTGVLHFGTVEEMLSHSSVAAQALPIRIRCDYTKAHSDYCDYRRWRSVEYRDYWENVVLFTVEKNEDLLSVALARGNLALKTHTDAVKEWLSRLFIKNTPAPSDDRAGG